MSRLAAAGAALCCLLLATASATAAGGLRVTGVDASDFPNVKATVVTPSPSSPAPKLREDGEAVDGVAAENLARSKSIVVAIDRSRSMAGQALDDATAAAAAFVHAKPPNDRLALVAFGHAASKLTGFSSSTIDAESALRTMPVDSIQGTALYDAVVTGSRALGREAFPGRVLIVLTDGANTSKSATLEQAIRAAHDAGAIVYPIGIESSDFSPAPLKRLASATGGTYYAAASSTALRDIYSSISREFQRTWRLTYVTSARRGDTLHLQVSVPGASPAAADYKIPGSSPDGDGSGSAVPSVLYDHGIGNLLVALLVGLCALGAITFVVAVPGGIRLKRRLDPHVAPTRELKGKAAPRERFAAAHGVMNATEKALGHMDIWKKLHRLIERADLPLRTVELVYIAGGAGLFFGLVCAVAGLSSIVILASMVVGVTLPIGFVWFKARRRLLMIETQLPDLLITIAASLKAGHSFRQGVQAVVDEGQGPASKEFKRVLTETRLGRPMDDALNEMAERLDSKNLSFVITAVTIQRQVGGSLAGIFDMVAEAVRQRQQFARKIRSLTAMGRMSAYVLIGLPFFIAGAITTVNAGYMDPLYHSSTGHFLIGLGLAMMTVGSLMLKKIVSFKG